jgi:hypothetical protein
MCTHTKNYKVSFVILHFLTCINSFYLVISFHCSVPYVTITKPFWIYFTNEQFFSLVNVVNSPYRTQLNGALCVSVSLLCPDSNILVTNKQFQFYH